MPDSIQNRSTQSILPVSPVPWWKSSLFWRTFFLVGILLVISMGAWILELSPRTAGVACTVDRRAGGIAGYDYPGGTGTF